MIAIIDYDAGNLKSVEKALNSLGHETVVSRDSSVILEADKVILPGVGSFGDAMNNLDHFGLIDTIKKVAASKTPFLGICLGLQLLFERSDETPGAEGLSILPGQILRIPPSNDLKIPHMGWNSLKFYDDNPLFNGTAEGQYVYFVHSFFAKCNEGLSATCDYGIEVTAAVRKNNVFGMQFHPEKSGEVGLNILKQFELYNG